MAAGPGPTLGFLSGTLSPTTEKAPRTSGPLEAAGSRGVNLLLFYIRRNFMGLQGLAEVAQPGRRGAGPVVTWIQVLGSPRLPFPRDVTPSRAQPLGISQGQGQTQGQPARQGVSSTTPRSSSQPSGARSPLTGPHRLVSRLLSRLLSLMDATSRPSLGGVAVRAGFICPSLAVSSAFLPAMYEFQLL